MLNQKTWTIDEVRISKFGIEKVREFEPEGKTVRMHNIAGEVDEVRYNFFLMGYVKVREYHSRDMVFIG